VASHAERTGIGGAVWLQCPFFEFLPDESVDGMRLPGIWPGRIVRGYRNRDRFEGPERAVRLGLFPEDNVFGPDGPLLDPLAQGGRFLHRQRVAFFRHFRALPRFADRSLIDRAFLRFARQHARIAVTTLEHRFACRQIEAALGNSRLVAGDAFRRQDWCDGFFEEFRFIGGQERFGQRHHQHRRQHDCQSDLRRIVHGLAIPVFAPENPF
jgi:hypothetical protein